MRPGRGGFAWLASPALLASLLFVVVVAGGSAYAEGIGGALIQLRQADPLSRAFLSPFGAHFSTPAEMGVRYEEVSIRNAMGFRLHGWLLDREETDRTILVCMGNTGNISHMLPYGRILYDAGFDVLLFDYQGFGKSEGIATGISLVGDAAAAWNHLRVDRKLPADRIGVLGISLGSVLALRVASKETPRAVAVEDVFLPGDFLAMLRDAAKESLTARAGLALVEKTVLPLVDPLATLPQVKCPLLFVHGASDWLLPPSGTIRAADVAVSQKRVWMIPHVGHAPETLVAAEREYAHQLGRFFREAFEVGRLSDVRVSFETLSSDEHGPRIELRPDVAGHRPLLIALAGGEDELSFTRVYADAPEAERVVRPGFTPERIFAIEYGHVIDQRNGTWREDLSPLSRSYRGYHVFLTQALDRLERRTRRLIQHGKMAYSVHAYTVDDWKWMAQNHPKPADVHPRIRPRYTHLLAEMALGLTDRDAKEAAARMMVLFLPEDPLRHFELGNASFSLGYQSLFGARACLIAARRAAREGDFDEARRLVGSFFAVWPAYLDPGIDPDLAGRIRSEQDLIFEGIED